LFRNDLIIGLCKLIADILQVPSGLMVAPYTSLIGQATHATKHRHH